MHDHKIEGSISSSEGGFPFITRSDADEVVGTTEVNLGVDGGGAEAIKEVGNERKWVLVFLGDGIKTMPIDAKSERAVFLFDKKNRRTTGGLRVADEITTEILFEEALEGFGFSFRGRIDWTKCTIRGDLINTEPLPGVLPQILNRELTGSCAGPF